MLQKKHESHSGKTINMSPEKCKSVSLQKSLCCMGGRGKMSQIFISQQTTRLLLFFRAIKSLELWRTLNRILQQHHNTSAFPIRLYYLLFPMTLLTERASHQSPCYCRRKSNSRLQEGFGNCLPEASPLYSGKATWCCLQESENHQGREVHLLCLPGRCS